MRALDETFTALADPTRRRVVELLRKGPRRAGQLAAEMKMSAPAMSRHLRTLFQHGLIADQRVGEDARLRVYWLKPERFRELSEWLDHIEEFWIDELHAFKAHVEKTKK